LIKTRPLVVGAVQLSSGSITQEGVHHFIDHNFFTSRSGIFIFWYIVTYLMLYPMVIEHKKVTIPS